MSSTNGADGGGGLTPSSRNYTRTNNLQRDMAWDTELTNYIVTGSQYVLYPMYRAGRLE